jgi:methylglutaconyl-CoA hydratase
MISPYVIAAIGQRQAHYYFLTGEKFSAQRALEIDLIHQMVEAQNLMNTGISLAQTLMQNSPQALSSAKKLIAYVANQKINEDLAQKTAQHLAELRMTHEAQEGLKSFLEKRKASWVK